MPFSFEKVHFYLVWACSFVAFHDLVFFCRGFTQKPVVRVPRCDVLANKRRIEAAKPVEASKDGGVLMNSTGTIWKKYKKGSYVGWYSEQALTHVISSAAEILQLSVPQHFSSSERMIFLMLMDGLTIVSICEGGGVKGMGVASFLCRLVEGWFWVLFRLESAMLLFLERLISRRLPFVSARPGFSNTLKARVALFALSCSIASAKSA